MEREETTGQEAKETEAKEAEESATGDQKVDLQAAQSDSRLEILWRLVIFQAKLVVDGARDVVLLPISLVAGIIDFAKGDSANFDAVLRLGRQTEHWINLFGHQRQGTADQLLDPVKERFLEEAGNNQAVQKANHSLDRSLGAVNDALKRDEADKPEPPGN